jgi:hypothetical protein
MRGTLSLLAATLLLALSTREAPARQATTVPGLVRPGNVGPVGTVGPPAEISEREERGQKFVASELPGEVISEVGARLRDSLGPDQEMLDRIWVVCPDTFRFLRDLPERLQLQVVRGIVARAWTRPPLTTGFNPILPTIQSIPMPAMGRDWRHQRFAEFGVVPDPATDGLLLAAARTSVLVHTPSIPPELRSSLIQQRSDWNLLTAVELFATWPRLATAILELPPGLRVHAIERLNLEMPESIEDPPRPPRSADERLRASLTSLTAQLAREQKDWPGVLAELASTQDTPLFTLHESAAPRRLRFLTTRGDTSTAHLVEVPRWERRHLDKRVVARDFARLAGLPKAGQPVLFLGGGSDYSTHDLLPGRLTARSFDDSPRFTGLHVENFRQLAQRRLAPASTILFDLIPDSLTAVRRLGLPGSARLWRQAHRRVDALARRHGMILGDGRRRDQLVATLRQGVHDAIIVVARGERSGIFLADGSQLALGDVLDLPPAGSTPRPVVLLVSCASGFDASLRRLGQAFLLRGWTSAVLAPIGSVPVPGETERMLENLLHGGEPPARSALTDLSSSLQLYV